jgi:fructoselysine-6-P-deglycase FrlB-like protein
MVGGEMSDNTRAAIAEHVEQAKASEYFSGARLGDDLARFLGSSADTCRAIGEELAGAKQLYLVGCGGSLATLQTARYALDGVLDVPVDVLHGYDLIWRSPARLGPHAAVVLASYSGETEDVVAALRFAKERGARTVAIVGGEKGGSSTLAAESDHVVDYATAAIFEAPVAALVRMAAAIDPRAEELDAALAAVPDAARAAFAIEEERAEERARALLSSRHLYVLGTGPLAPLAYKVALTVVMENIRIGGTWCDASEFRHGPAEGLERSQLDALVLLGTDESRTMSERTLAFLAEHGARTQVFDARDYPEVHPLLTPLVLNLTTQWFTVWSAALRGIVDLDDRVFMGRHVLAQGGHRWP